jgi:hypothetical protein
MEQLLGIFAVALLGLGARHFYLHRKNKGKRPLEEKKLEVWEGEGGAVPVSRKRTAAQVSPRRSKSASPRADS